MSVPTFTLLTESQFDPGKPMTQEIGLALWRNWMAVLGVDDTDASPNLTYGPGMLVSTEVTPHVTGTTPPEFIASDLTAGFETNTQENGICDGVLKHMILAKGTDYLPLTICGIDAHYTAGSPDGINIRVVQSGTRYFGGTGPFNNLTDWQTASYVVANDNSWKILVKDDSGSPVDRLRAKCRTSGNNLMLQFDISGSYTFVNVRRTFQYKG